MPIRHRYPPVGSKMNDAGYPFRGEYKLEPPLNHGHAGAIRKENTYLMFRITGSNLAIEKLQPCKGQKLQCELGIDDGPEKPINFPTGSGTVPVPNDGHEYHLTAIVQGTGSKHYCKMSLNGTAKNNIFRLRAPVDAHGVENIKLIVDGEQISPSGGWYTIPTNAKECSLHYVGKDPVMVAPVPHALQRANENATIMVQTTLGTLENAAIFCSGNGELVHLSPDRPVRLSVDSGPYTFLLPRVPAAPVLAPVPAVTMPSTQPTVLDEAPTAVPVLETMTSESLDGPQAPPVFVTTADGFMIELVGDNGMSASGYGRVQLPLPDRQAHRIQIKVSDMNGRVYLRQTTMVPATDSPPVRLSLAKNAMGSHTVKGGASSQITVDNQAPVNGAVGASLVSGGNHVVMVKEGPATLILDIDTSFDHGNLSTAATAVPQPAIPTPPQAAKNEAWVHDLACALQCADADTMRQKIQTIVPSNPDVTAILGFVSEQLFRTPPTISFSREAENVSDIRCPGYNVTASVDNGAPCVLSGVSSIQIPAGHKVTLSAVSTVTGLTVASCCAHYPSLSQRNPDEVFVARLLDIFQRCGLSPEVVLTELQNVSQPQSASGQQLLSMLTGTFRRLLEISPSTISIVSGDVPEKGQILIAVNNQHPRHLSRRGAMKVTDPNCKLRISYCEEKAAPVQPHNEFVSKMVDAYSRGPPSELINRWMAVPVEAAEEKSLIDLLVHILKEHEVTLRHERDRIIASSAPDTLYFECDGTSLRNIRSKKASQLSYNVDGTGFLVLGQGGQIPQGYTFPKGSSHSVELVARNTADNVMCGEVVVTLKESEEAKALAAAEKREVSFLDTNMAVVMEEVHLKLMCSPKFRIKCDVDGGEDRVWGSHSECVARMNASCGHRVNVSLLDSDGNAVFQHRIVVPPMLLMQWALRMENNSLHVDSCGVANGASFTASINRAAERELSGPLMLDGEGPHTVLLRRYASAAEYDKICTGEVYLMLPPLIESVHLKELTNIFHETIASGGDEMQRRLNDLCMRVPSGTLKEFISAFSRSMAANQPSIERGRSAERGPRVHFRITGDESKGVPFEHLS
uniref:WGS project CAEQ00000000 data, annotated contig 934 n=1 Tax=Trypanosoma congolense (strain IL3000) TaxID=1068625 RepID=F9WJP7_TRYCI|nr:unnamed protein product [Trypanosoma congolense IL3000]